MNIGVDIRALTAENRSGVGSYIFEALRHIIQADKKNQYYFFNSSLTNVYFPKELEAENVHQVHLRVPNKILNFCLYFGLYFKLEKYFPVKLDLFWLPNINFINLDTEAPLLVTIHDLSFLHSQNFYSFKRKWWHKLINVKALVEKAKYIIAVSQNSKRDLIRFFTVNEEKIQVIYPGLQCQSMTKEKALAMTEDFGLAENFFIFLGTLEPRKNVEGIIKAFDRYHLEYPDVELVLVGNKGWVYHKLLLSIKKRPYIKYLGFIAGDKRDALYFLSQALIWPSFYEGFGFPPLEATMHGKPVITSYKTSLPEIMRTQALYVDPYNSGEIYQLLKVLTTDKDLYEHISQGAHKFGFVSWPKQAQKIINLFEKCE